MMKRGLVLMAVLLLSCAKHSLLDSPPQKPSAESAASRELLAWQETSRVALIKALGPLPTLDASRVEQTASKRSESLLYFSMMIQEDSEDIPCAVIYPLEHKNRENSLPGFLLIPAYGHSISDYLATPNGKPVRLDATAAFYLADQGFVVVACELRGFGQLADPNPDARREAAAAKGTTLLAQQIQDGWQALQLLRGINIVQTDMVVVGGGAGGVALFLAALDPSLFGLIEFDFLNEYVNNADFDSKYSLPNNISLSFEELGCLVAPRPAMYSNPPAERSVKGVPEVESVKGCYETLGHSDDFWLADHGERLFFDLAQTEDFLKSIGLQKAST